MGRINLSDVELQRRFLDLALGRDTFHGYLYHALKGEYLELLQQDVSPDDVDLEVNAVLEQFKAAVLALYP